MNEMAKDMKRGSRMGMFLGIATVVVGFLCMMAPGMAGVATATFVGVLLILGGIARLVFAFGAPSFGQGILTFLFGGLSILCGVVMLARPLLGLASLAMVLVAYFVVDGISEIIAAFKMKPEKGWGWLFFGGLASLVLGIMIWRQWPASGIWAIGILVGIHFIFSGFAMITMASATRGAAKEMDAAT